MEVMAADTITSMASSAISSTSSAVSKLLPIQNPLRSFWHTDPHALNDHRSTEQLPEHSDIVIIGGGYAGVATAYHLVKDRDPAQVQPSITLLEARYACSGATGRNGGHLRPDLYGHIPVYVDRFGSEEAARYAEFEISHVPALKKVIEEENIDCDFTLTRQVDVFCTDEGAQMVKDVFEKMSAYNFKYFDDVQVTFGPEAEAISGVKGAKACASSTAAHLWAYRLMLSLLSIVVSTGDVNLQTHTPVHDVTPSSSGGFIVNTPRGPIHASKVVYATNAYTSALLPEYFPSIVPCKGICTRITTTSEPTQVLTKSYVVRDQEGTLTYLIPRSDGSIVVGGASKKFRPHREQWYNNVDDSVLIDAAKDWFEGFMQRTFYGWENTDAKVDKIWTGVMGYSYDSLSHIGEVPGKTDQYIIAGFNGHGMPVIWLAAKGIAKMVREGSSFEETGLPRMIKTTKERIDRAKSGPEGGDILGDLPATMWAVKAPPTAELKA